MMPIFKRKKTLANEIHEVFGQDLGEFKAFFRQIISSLKDSNELVIKLSTKNQVLTNRIEDLINKLEVKPKTTRKEVAPPKEPTEWDSKF
jgi:hypothetical protein